MTSRTPAGPAPRPGAGPAGYRDDQRPRLRTVLAALSITEITSWGVLYYAFPVLAPAISADTGWSVPAITAAFSAALVVAALLGIPAGRHLDRYGPRTLMTGGSVLAVVSVLGIAFAPNLWWFTAAWLVAGIAMAAVLYPPAFAALTRYYGPRHLTALTALTLVAGLSSTVFAPLTDALAGHLSWRATYLVLAVLLAAFTIPLHAVALRRPWPAAHHDPTVQPPDGGVRAVLRSRAFLMLTAALTLSGFAMFAALTNLIPLLTGRGATATAAAWALGLGGAGQVAGRLAYTPIARRAGLRTRTVTILGLSAATTAALALLPGPVVLLVAAAVLAGTTRGIATLLQATAITDRWGHAHYGTLSAILTAPITIAMAISPWAGATLATAQGGYPQMFLTLTVIAALATAFAAASVPRGGRHR